MPHTEVPSILHQRLVIISQMRAPASLRGFYNIPWAELKLAQAEPSKFTTTCSSDKALKTYN